MFHQSDGVLQTLSRPEKGTIIVAKQPFYLNYVNSEYRQTRLFNKNAYFLNNHNFIFYRKTKLFSNKAINKFNL